MLGSAFHVKSSPVQTHYLDMPWLEPGGNVHLSPFLCAVCFAFYLRLHTMSGAKGYTAGRCLPDERSPRRWSMWSEFCFLQSFCAEGHTLTKLFLENFLLSFWKTFKKVFKYHQRLWTKIQWYSNANISNRHMDLYRTSSHLLTVFNL